MSIQLNQKKFDFKGTGIFNFKLFFLGWSFRKDFVITKFDRKQLNKLKG